MLEKTLENPLDCKEIKPVNPKGNQSWIFIGRTDAETISNTLATWCEELTQWKRPWCWERLRPGGEGDDRGSDGGMASPTWWTWVWVNSGSWYGQGSLVCCSPWGHKESDTTERLNWTELHFTVRSKLIHSFKIFIMFLLWASTKLEVENIIKQVVSLLLRSSWSSNRSKQIWPTGTWKDGQQH